MYYVYTRSNSLGMNHIILHARQGEGDESLPPPSGKPVVRKGVITVNTYASLPLRKNVYKCPKNLLQCTKIYKNFKHFLISEGTNINAIECKLEILK